MTPEYTIYALWVAWLVSWTVAMLWSNRTEKRDGIGAELFFRLLFYVSLILLFAFPPRHHYYAQTQLWHFGDAMNWILVAVTATGLLFTWWARIQLGRPTPRSSEARRRKFAHEAATGHSVYLHGWRTILALGLRP